MPPSLLGEIIKEGKYSKLSELTPPRKYCLAVTRDGQGNSVHAICDKQVVVDVLLYIRHRSALRLRNVTWYVAQQEVPEPLLGKQVLHALGLDTRMALEAARVEHNGEVDISQIMSSLEETAGSVARVIEDGVFHNTVAVLDAIDDDLPVCEFGNDSDEEVKKAIEDMVTEPGEQGFTLVEELKGILQEYREVFRCRLGRGRPANLEPMKVSICEGARPIKCKVRNYSKDQREILKSFFDNATEMGFMRKNPNASWTAAPLLVPKPSPKHGAAK